MADKDFLKTLEGYGLTTAEIIYGLPDHPHLLQAYLWQEYDVAPHFPVLESFLSYWKKELAGPLKFVKVAHNKLITPAEFTIAKGLYTIQ